MYGDVVIPDVDVGSDKFNRDCHASDSASAGFLVGTNSVLRGHQSATYELACVTVA